MGAWGEGPFDNDDAADFAGDLADLTEAAAVLAELSRALSVHSTPGFVEAPTMNEGIAAASIVAMLAGASTEAIAYAPSPDKLESMASALTPELRDAAARVFRRAFEPTDNEWYDLWDEGSAIEDVRQAMRVYMVAVGA